MYNFPSRPELYPKIYAYTENKPEYKNLIKIGYTTRSVEERMKEHFPTKGPKNIKKYKMYSSEVNKYIMIRDATIKETTRYLPCY